MTPRKKLIEVALPLEAINEASAREKSIRHGHPSTLHLWWARRPLAACRAVIFTSLVDDPDDPNAPPEFVEACRRLPRGKNAAVNDTPRQRLFDFIETLVQWESTTDENVLETARELIRLSTDGNPPPLLDPFAGGGSIPLEAQRLGLEAHASDLNPVAVMINKALIEIPPRFANRPPVNPRDRGGTAQGMSWKGAQGLAADVRYYGEWMRDRAWERIGHLYPKYTPHPRPLPQHEGGEAGPHPPAPSPTGREGLAPHPPAPSPKMREGLAPHPPAPSPKMREGEMLPDGGAERWDITPEMERRMRDVARELRKNPTPSEDILWQAIRKEQLDGRKFRRQMPIGPFVVDFYCSTERLAVEVDGPIHETQREADRARQELLESFGIRFVRVTAEQVEQDLPGVLATIRAAFSPTPSPKMSGDAAPLPSAQRGGRGQGMGGETVIAWLWARTVKCPNPACGAQMPLVSSFELSKKKGRQAWVEPEIDRHAKAVRFKVYQGVGQAPPPPKIGRGAKFRCLVCGEIAPDQHIKDEGMAGRMGAQLMAIVTEGQNGRNYYAPTPEHEQIARQAQPTWAPSGELPDNPRWFSPPMYGMKTFESLFTPRQLVALTTFSDLVSEAREQVYADALAAGLPDDGVPLREGGSGARAYAEAVSVYLAFAVDRLAEKCNTLSSWQNTADFVRGVFARQAIAMVWDYADVNPFSGSTGNFGDALVWVAEVLESNFSNLDSNNIGNSAILQDATRIMPSFDLGLLSTDPPYYDNIGYADLSDFFYVWMRRSLQNTSLDVFGTLLVPKQPELVATPYRFGGDKEAADRHFETGLQQAFARMWRIVHPDFPLTVYYAFKQSESEEDNDGEGGKTVSSTGWETMLEGLIQAGFMVDGTWPMRTERGGRTNSLEANALASSIVLVCRPRPDDAPTTSRREFVNALRRELPPALREMQSGNIAPVDLAQAAIGPGMAVYSRYSRVLEADGSPLTVRTALQLINQELDAFLAESEGDVDADTRFCIAWFEQFGFKEDEFGRADVLARAKNTSVDGLANAGVITAGAGKVRLYQWHELEPGWTPQGDKRVTVWECVHHLIERINTHGESGAAALLMRMHSDLAAEAKNLAYRLYQICDRKGWAEYALEYNALVLSWPRLQELANELKQNQPPEQLGMF